MQRSKSFEDLILKLTKSILKNNEEKSHFLDELEMYYSRNGRHSYSIISRLIFSSSSDETIEFLELNLSELRILSKELNKRELQSKIEKLLDHVNLSVIQKKHIEDYREHIKQDILQLKRESYILAKEIEGHEKTVRNAENKIQNIYREFIVILGIFTTIIFASFGGLEILTNILGNISEVRTGKLLLFSSLCVSGITLLLFILLNGIGKLTNLNLKSCGCSTNTNCAHNIFKKYPAIIIPNLILLYIFFIGVTLYIIDYKLLFAYLLSDLSLGNQFILLIATLFIVAMLLCSFFIIMFKSDIKKSVDKDIWPNSSISHRPYDD